MYLCSMYRMVNQTMKVIPIAMALVGIFSISAMNRNAAVVNAVVYIIMNFDVGTKWKITHSMSVFGAESPLELIEKISFYSFHNTADKIKCPTLLLAGEKDHSFAGQAQRLYDLLKSPKKYILFTEEEGAEDHCHVGALSLANQRIFDWLDETLEN